MRRARLLVAAVCGAVLASVALPAAPAAAADGFSAAARTADGPALGSAGACSMYASTNGFGMVCGGGGVRPGFLDQVTQRLPDCRHDEPLPEGFKPDAPPKGEVWVLEACLFGIDRNRLVRTGPISLIYRIRTIPRTEAVTLTGPADQAWDYFVGRGQFDFPILGASPVSSPRVAQVSSFHLLSETRTPDLKVRGGDVTMWAEVVRLEFDPGDGERNVSCVGPGRELTAEQVAELEVDGQGRSPESSPYCTYAYQRSSQGAGGGTGDLANRYDSRALATWRVYYREGDGAVQVLGDVTKESVNRLRVTELQTVNIR